MPSRAAIFRLVSLAGFLVAVALTLWLADLRAGVVAGGMALAWAIASLVELFSWREDRRHRAG